jgi:hypothetical protein
MDFNILLQLGIMFTGQVVLIGCLVAFVKDQLALKGNRVRLVSFVFGLVTGGLIFWVYLYDNPGMALPHAVLTGALFLVGSGLTASGYYDYKNEEKGLPVFAGEIGGD